jgi:hypothetical protein
VAVDRAPVPRTALSIEEACASIGCSWKFWTEYVAPTLPVVRLGRRRLVPVAALEAWLEEHASTLLNPGDGRAAYPGTRAKSPGNGQPRDRRGPPGGGR